MNKKILNQIIEVIEDVPGWMRTIKDCFGEQAEKYAGDYIDDRDREIEKAENYYYKIELPKVRKKIEEFKKENKEFAEECKMRREKELQESFKKKYKMLEKNLEVYGNLKEKKRLLQEMEMIERKLNSKITDEMILKAREFPLEELINTKKHFSICPFHSDKHPSFYTKNNYGYCFSCGWKGDVIKFTMDTKNVSFSEAIKMLNR